MPTLNWIGKDTVVTHHMDVPYRLLEPVSVEIGHMLVVEYKGADRYDQPEQVEKRRIDELWARRAAAEYHFVIPKQRDWPSIRATLNA